MTDSERLYIASKTKYAQDWITLRNSGWPIISTWIDEAGPGETNDFRDLWVRCISEARQATGLLVCGETVDLLKGALVEVGAALGNGVPVVMVAPRAQAGDTLWGLKSARNHPLVLGQYTNVWKARDALRAHYGWAPIYETAVGFGLTDT
jgi:hypothetical protein